MRSQRFRRHVTASHFHKERRTFQELRRERRRDFSAVYARVCGERARKDHLLRHPAISLHWHAWNRDWTCDARKRWRSRHPVSDGLGTDQFPEWRLDASLSRHDISVFDSTYVRDNVFAGDAVDTEHRRNLYRVIIGARGVALAGSLDAIDNQLKTKTAEIRDNRAIMQRYIPQGMTVDAFIALPEDPEIGAKIAAKNQELQAVRQATQLHQKAGLSALTVPVFPASFAALLAKTFENVAADAERHVSDHIARHGMQALGETWISEGLQYIAAETCPFCDQELDAVGLIQDYRSYFSREYHALRDEVAALKSEVDRAMGERIAAGIEQTVLLNDSAVEYWKQFCVVQAPTLPEAGSIGLILGALRDSAQALLDTKTGTPLDAVPPDDRFTRSLRAFEELRTSLGTYNAGVGTANAVITGRKQQAQAAILSEVEAALANLKAQKARHSEEACALCDMDARLRGDKVGLEGDKATLRGALDNYTQQVIT